jgi:hypothetical protein
MEQNEIDRIFREQLKKAQYPFDESNWEQFSKVRYPRPYKIKLPWVAALLLIAAGSIWVATRNPKTVTMPSKEWKGEQPSALAPNKAKDRGQRAHPRLESSDNAMQPIQGAEEVHIPIAGQRPEEAPNDPMQRIPRTNEAHISISNQRTVDLPLFPPILLGTVPGDTVSGLEFVASKQEQKEEVKSRLTDETPRISGSYSAVQPTDPAQDAKDSLSKEFPKLDSQIQTLETQSDTLLLGKNKRKESTWTLGFFGTPYYLRRTLLDVDPGWEPYVQFRKKYETPLVAFSYGLEWERSFQQWLVSSGIQRTEIVERLNYPTTLSVPIGIDNGSWNVWQNWTFTQDSTWVIDSIYAGHWNIDTLWSVTRDSSWAAQWDTLLQDRNFPEIGDNNGLTSWSYTEIPLMLGRTYSWRKWQLDVLSGLTIGVLTGHRGGYYIRPRLDGLWSPEMQQSQFRIWNYQWMLRTRLKYALENGVALHLAPTFRYSMHSHLGISQVKQRYTGVGISFGVQYSF